MGNASRGFRRRSIASTGQHINKAIITTTNRPSEILARPYPYVNRSFAGRRAPDCHTLMRDCATTALPRAGRGVGPYAEHDGALESSDLIARASAWIQEV